MSLGTLPGRSGQVEMKYDQIIEHHAAMIEKLVDRLEAADTLGREAVAARKAADGLSAGGAEMTRQAHLLEEAVTAAGMDATSAEGALAAAEAFSAADAAQVEELCGELDAEAVNIATITEAAQAAVEHSEHHIEATYGGLADGVQSTGIKGEALESNG